MPYDISTYSPTFGGVINSSGNVVNVGDTVDGSGNVKVAVQGGITVNTGDIEIGAVELKDGTTDTRAVVDSTYGLGVDVKRITGTVTTSISGTPNVTVTPTMSALLTFQTGATTTGNGTAVDVTGYNTIVVMNTISGTATVTYEVSQDATTWATIVGQNIGTFGSLSATGSATGQVRINISGSKWVRVRVSAFTSGTVDVIGYASVASNFYTPYAAAFGNSDTNSAGQTIQGVGAYNLLFDGTNFSRQRSVGALGDATSSSVLGLPSTALHGYNGTGYDRVRTIVGAADGSAGTGVVANSNILYNGTTYNKSRDGVGVADGSTGAGIQGTTLSAWNNATYDRVRMGNRDDYAYGILGTVPMGWSSTGVYTRQRLNDLKGNKFLGIGTFTAATEYLVLTPTTGKTFRLMGISVNYTGVGNVFIRDGSGGNFHSMSFAVAKDTQTFYFGNGYLFGAANNSLYIYNNATTGSAWITVWGMEE